MKVNVSVVSADLAAFLKAAAFHGVKLYDVQSTEPLKIRFWIKLSDLETVEKIAQKRGDSCAVLRTRGTRLRYRQICSRWLLILVLLCLAVLSVWLPSRVLFISVEGNANVSTQKILLAAEAWGAGFGANRADLRSVQLKNFMLEKIPEIGWVGVNTYGCTAIIRVIERTDSQTVPVDETTRVGIYAALDGLIVSQTIHTGFTAVSVGQAVKTGQLLVSGNQSDGITERYVRPNAEVYALTNRAISVAMPSNASEISYTGKVLTGCHLLIGKKRINLLKDSRIYPTLYDKIHKEFYLTLPGGFVLPFGIAIERYSEVEIADCTVDERDVQELVDDYVRSQMISGRILDRQVSYDMKNRMTVRYCCLEMIGREYSEEFDALYGKNN